MKSAYRIALAGALALSFLVPAEAASLLGGLIKTGTDSGNNTQPVSVGTGSGGTSVGLLGTGGVSLNLPTGGGSGGLPGLGSGNVGVPGVASLTTSSGSGGTGADLGLLGGGGSTLSLNPGGLLGGDGGLGVTLPGLGGTGGTGGVGGGGGNGGGGPVINYYGNGGGGGSFAIPSGISSRLQMLLRILAERDYLQLSNGRAVCLNSFGVAEVAGWIKKSEYGALQQALAGYSQDIYTLRQLLANCRSNDQRQALNLSNLNRVIGIDIGPDGRPVLYML